MYLKSIEVQGFKSFANKINFQFHNGITAIVGPNGSGKSNVADAVRWVLGEQRIKQLRGASMQDVIFSGTELRKPLSSAYVAITLDNSDHQLAIDYEEVTIARRLYRSGESEYMINGTVCRLKDVHELFYDTGIGKEGYSIIGQGQIEKILNGKPEERRELFDEAAGIVKFKRRKYTAIKKLEDEKANLVRVGDILSELEKQVVPLEKQSQKARIYLDKRDELKKLDVNCFLLEQEKMKSDLLEVDGKYKIAEDELQAVTQQYEKTKEDYENTREQMSRCEEDIEQNRSMLENSNLMKGKMESQIALYREQINSAKSNSKHFETRKESITASMSTKEVEKERLLLEKNKVEESVQKVLEKKDELSKVLDHISAKIMHISDAMEHEKNTIIEELNQRAMIKSKIGRIDTMSEQVAIKRAELNAKMLRMKTEEVKQQELISSLELQFKELASEMELLEKEQLEKTEAVNKIRQELNQLDLELRDKEQIYHREQSRLDALSNLTERYEGYGGSIKRVMELKDQQKGIVGVVADILKTEKKYELAIETALGGSIQNIVTTDEEVAKRIISYLKQQKAGRATFLPLTSMKNTQAFKMTECLKEPGVLGLADSLVQVDDKYSLVAKSLLGRVVVVDHIDQAVKIARKYQYSVRMVTLEGDSIVPGGAMSGGAFKNNSNLLGRRREMDDLQKAVEKMQAQIKEQLELIETKREMRNRLRIEEERCKSKLQMKALERNTAEINLETAKEKSEESGIGNDQMQAEIEQLEKQVLEVAGEKKIISMQLLESEQKEKEANLEVAELQKVLQEEGEKEEQAIRSLSDFEVEVQKNIQARQFAQMNLERVLEDISSSQRELDEILETMELGSTDVIEKEKAIEELLESLLQSDDKLAQAKRDLEQAQSLNEELKKSQNSFFTKREEISSKMSELDKEVFRLQAQKEKIEETMEQHINYMWDEYELTLSECAQARDLEMIDLLGMKKDIARVKSEIKALGSINVNAIEEYKEVLERYSFLKKQHDDLIEAEKTLQDIIVELDTLMKKQFREKFAQIREEFDKVFKELFGGGKGALEMLEDEDILEAGIRINAQPPGKKLQNMMQMSGGEKALTAIALLFAIQNLKPSPFCLLDEIEAALDESNVGRYAKYLHKLTKHTQFIVITHRRGTMEEADRLYGITMQEKGISALVSVDLVDSDLD